MAPQMQNWNENIPVVKREDGWHISLLDEDTRNRFAEAVTRGKGPISLGSGNTRVYFEFQSQEEQNKTGQPGQQTR